MNLKKKIILKLKRKSTGLRPVSGLSVLIVQPTDFQSVVVEFNKSSKIPVPTAKRILSVLRDEGVLKTIRSPSGRKSAIYAFAELINIAEGDDLF